MIKIQELRSRDYKKARQLLFRECTSIGMIVCECWLFTFLLIPDMIITKERERVTAFDCINLYFWR